MFLEVSGLSLSMEGKKILKNISFSADEGSVTLIAGVNGSGKTMLLKCIKGLEKEDSGSISLNGEKIGKRRERMEKFALVFQDPSLGIVGATVEKDIAFGLENIGMDRDGILKRTDEYIDLFSLGSVRNLRPNVLSGGEKRKLSIASVLAMGPRVLLLDEPFANLDYPSVITVLETLTNLKERGITILIVSHEVEKFLKHTDRVIIMSKGEIISSGNTADMIDELGKNNVYIPPGSCLEDLSWL